LLPKEQFLFKKEFCFSVTEYSHAVNAGMVKQTEGSRLRFPAGLLPQIVGSFVMIMGSGSGEGVCVHLMDFTNYTIGGKHKKMADQLPRYQVLLILEIASSPSSTAASHNGPLNALSGSRLTRLMS
jgi:hypothetical protein